MIVQATKAVMSYHLDKSVPMTNNNMTSGRRMFIGIVTLNSFMVSS